MIVERVGRDELEFEGMIYLRKIVPFAGQAFMSLGLATVDVARPTRPMAKCLTLSLPWNALPVRSDVALAAVGEAAGWSAGISTDSCWTVNRRRHGVRAVCVRELTVVPRKGKARIDGELALTLAPGRRTLLLSISKESVHLLEEVERPPPTVDALVERVRTSTGHERVWRLLDLAEQGGREAASALRGFMKDRALDPGARDYARRLVIALKAGQTMPDPPH